MAKSLPPELLGEIIRYLTDDRRSLKAVSLVNKSWLEAARERLFHRFPFPPFNSDFVLDGDYARLLSESNTQPFVFVRDFVFRGNQLANKQAILLRISNMRFFSNLTQLWLSYLDFPCVRSVLEMIAACAQLESLSLEHVRFLQSTDSTPQTPNSNNLALPNTLRRVRFRHTSAATAFLTFFPPTTTSEESIKITHLSLSPITQAEMVTFRAISDNLLGQFQHVAVAYAFFGPEYTYWCQEARAELVLKRLLSMYVGNFVAVAGGSHYNPATRVIPALLAILQSPLLEKIVLELAVDRVGQVDEEASEINWASLDDLFASGKVFPALREVCFHASGRADVEGLASLLMGRLPLSHKRGLLKLCPEYESPL